MGNWKMYNSAVKKETTDKTALINRIEKKRRYIKLYSKVT